MISWEWDKERGLLVLMLLVVLLHPGQVRAQSIDSTLDGLVSGPEGLSFGGFGFSVAMAGDVDGDGFDDILVGDSRGVNPPADGQWLGDGQAYLIPGASNGLDGRDLFSHPSFRRFFLSQDPVNGDAANVASVGNVVRRLGDVNADGRDDFFIGVSGRRVDFDPGGDPLNNEGNDFPIGSGFVVYGINGSFPVASDLRQVTSSGGGFEILGRDVFGRLGRDAAAAGDVNGDGIDDFIVSAPRAGAAELRDSGEAYVIFGRSGGYSDNLDLGTISGTGIAVGGLDGSNGFVIAGRDADRELGRSVDGIGDFNGDGFSDIVLTSPSSFQFTGTTGVASTAGAVYVVFGGASGHGGAFDIGTLDGSNGFAIYNAFVNDGNELGAGVGDVNGDGFDDFGIVILNQPVQILLGTDESLDPLLDARDLAPERAISFSYSRVSLAGVGDINSDGFDDFIVGTGIGAATIGYGAASGLGSQTVSDPVGATLNFGQGLAGNGDFNGDGLADLVIGGSGTSGARGAVALLLGENTAAEYLSWIDQFYPGVTDPSIIGYNQDPNSDGIVNALAYAMDLSASENPTSPVVDISLAGEFATLTFRQRAQARDTFQLFAEVSTDFTNWTFVFDDFFGVSEEIDTNFFAPGTDRVRVSVPLNLFEEVFLGEPGEPLFARVQAFVR